MGNTSNTALAPDLAEWIRAKDVKTVFGIGRTPLDKLRKAKKIRSTTLQEDGEVSCGTRLYNVESIRAFLAKKEKEEAAKESEVAQ